MKHILRIALITFFCGVSCLATTKHALIFAIGDYPAARGWHKLSSNRDAAYIKASLQRYDFSDIRIVNDSMATVAGISKAFDQLIHDVGKGDIVVIHFSCHGEQLKALDPGKMSGLDQCIVTYNALLPKLSDNYERDQAEYFRGQTLGSYLSRLRSALGQAGDVLVLMDYCHSGTGTRGGGRKRGGEEPFVPPGYVVQQKTKQASSDLYETGMHTRGGEGGMASLVAVSATRPEEFDLETSDDKNNDIGSLTYAVSKTLETLDTGATYRFLFSRIQAIMNEKVPGQHPMIEGDGLDRKLFGGKYTLQARYFELSRLGDNNQVEVKGGILAGLDSGAVVGLYKAGAAHADASLLLSKGTVVSATPFTATVRLEKEAGINATADGWIFITEPVYRVKPIAVEVARSRREKARGPASDFSDGDVNAITGVLNSLPLVTQAGAPELLIVRGNDCDSLLLACNGLLMDTIANAAAGGERLKKKIEQYASYKFIRDIDLRNEDADVDVQLVPVINGVADTANARSSMPGGVYEFHNRDKIKLLVRNKGRKDLYINILDLQPNGQINAILPKKSRKIMPVDLRLKKGEQHLFADYTISIGPPYGTEVFKIFVSAEEIDMEGLATTGEARARGGGEGTRGNLSEMERLVKKSAGIASRGAEIENSESADGTTYNLLFNIVP